MVTCKNGMNSHLNSHCEIRAFVRPASFTSPPSTNALMCCFLKVEPVYNL